MVTDRKITAQIDAALYTHDAWCRRLEQAIETGTFQGCADHVARDDKCVFGQWLGGPMLSDEIRAGMPFQVVSRLHREFHICAGEVVALALSGRKRQASQILQGQFAMRSDKLIRALNKWRGELTMARAA